MVPPQDRHAEQSVIGGMLLSKDAIADSAEAVNGRDFYFPAHEMIYEAVIDLYGRGEPADAITVADELSKRGELQRVGGQPYLHELIQSVPTAANAGYYAQIVAERAVLRRLVEAGTRIVQMGQSDGGGDVVDVINAAQAEIFGVTAGKDTEDYVRLGEVVEMTADEIEAASSHGGQMTGVPTGFQALDELTNGLHPGQMIVIAARPAVGKALALDTPLPTPSGWTRMGEVRVGDELIGADGLPTRVVAATEVMVDRPCYEVEFTDGTVIVADAQHQWLTDTRASRRATQEASKRGTAPTVLPTVHTTAQIADTLRCATADSRLNHSVRLTAPLRGEETEFLLSPYVLGAWLGDGTTASAQITTADEQMLDLLRSEGIAVAPTAGYMRYSLKLPVDPIAARSCVVCGVDFIPQTSQVKTCSRSCGGRAKTVSTKSAPPTCPDCGQPSSGMRLCQKCYFDHGTVRARLRGMGVLGNKHIPANYLRASELQRRELLAGLLDTDGTVTSSGCVQFTTTSQVLVEGVQELIVSLGYRCGMSRKQVSGRTSSSSIAYTLTFSSNDDMFRLDRKRLLHKELRDRSFERRNSQFIVGVRPIPSVPVRCVEVDNQSHLYLASRSMIPTHNSTIGLDIARSASIKNNMASVIFSLEMGKVEISMRLLSAEAEIQLQHMRKGTMRDEDWAKLAKTMGRISDAPLFIDDSPNMSLMEIRSKCRRLKERHNLKLVVIDYLQLMTSGKKVESRQQEVSEFSRALKLLAKEIEVPVIAISQLNRGPEQRTDKRPQMSDLRESGCLTADSRILRADTGAEVSIGELATSGEKDVPIWALDDRQRLVTRTMTHAFSSGLKPVFRMTLASGKTLRLTDNHPLMTYDGWRALGDLKVGDRVAVPRHVPAPEMFEPWDSDDRVVLLAHMIGDGSFVKKQPIRYASIDEANLEAVSQAALSAFGVVAVRDEYAAARCTTLRLRAPYRLGHGKRNPIAAWLDELGLFGLRSHEKFVPESMFHASKRQIALFINHIWATGGSVTVNKSRTGGRIYYASTSRRLVDDLSQLLLRFGISTRTRVTRKGNYRDGYTIDVSGADSQRRFLQEVGVHGARSEQAAELLCILRGKQANTNVDTVPVQVWDTVKEVMSAQGMTHREFAKAMDSQFCGSTMWKHVPSRERMGRVAAVLDSADLELFAVNDVLWDTIKSVELDGVEETFDATVLGAHNFVANGISVHNSIEQDADMVMLLHREDQTNKESERVGEADIIVAKHRNGPTDTITVAFQGHYSRFRDMAQNF
ncbi:replicative DNA helicase [Yimella sp. cx-51]|uniref:replicative DNA helicase n=1 Tax=Yimella sp. cx-51 TaxID=2770551 RepID=UPI00165D680E|nr:replicative DNA helicase [Yimella sp. cx-51]MBC9957833.1 replicative DNA helicase [Yimella sp. cx-51]QTH39702.1 replicative DNA helicase [Yimella sp. cx-51]